MKEKNSSILTKALNEADTIRAGALKNAQDILFNAFQPHFKQMFNNVVNEQVGVVDQDPMDGANPSKYDQDTLDANLINPTNAMHKEGDGPELLEQDEEELDLEEQDGMNDEEFLEQLESDINLDEQDEDSEIQVEQNDLEDLEEQDEDEFEIDEQEEEELEIDEQDEDEFDLDEQDEDELEIDEQEEDELEIDEQDDIEVIDDEAMEQDEEDDIVIDEQDEEEFELDEQDDIEIIDDETSEQDNPDVNPSKDADYKTAVNEARKLKSINKKLRLENKKLSVGVKKLANKISEVNLFNAKVACANRVLSIKGLNENTKVTVLNTLDKCKNIREVKVAYTSFKNFVKTNNIKKQNTIKESKNLAALKSKTIGYKKQNTINESDSKMLRLAGLRD